MAVKKPNDTSANDIVRWILIGGLVVVAFFGAYKFASAGSGRATDAQAAASQVSAPPAQQAAASPNAAPGQGAANGGSAPASDAGGGCACCNGGASQPTADGVTGPKIDGTAKVAGGVQAIAIDVTTVYSPNVVHLKAGVPAEITFGPAQGCTSRVQSQALGFAEDLSAGPKVVSIKDPQPGTYDFACGMNMVHGKIVVE